MGIWYWLIRKWIIYFFEILGRKEISASLEGGYYIPPNLIRVETCLTVGIKVFLDSGKVGIKLSIFIDKSKIRIKLKKEFKSMKFTFFNFLKVKFNFRKF